MADQKVILEFSDDSIKSELNDTIDQLKQVAKESKNSGDVFKSAFVGNIKATEDFNDAIDDTVQNAKKLDTAIKDTSDSTKQARSEIVKSIKDYKVFGVSINDIQQKLGLYSKAAKTSATGTGTLSKALGILKVAIAATGVGALVLALGSLVAFLTRTQKGVDLVRRSFAGLTAAFNVIIDRLSGFGSILVDFFQGNAGLRDVINGARDAVKGFGAEVSSEAKAAAALTGELQRIRDAQQALTVEYAKARAEIKALNRDAEDVTLSLRDRANAASRAIEIESDLLNKQIKLKEDELAVTRQLNALGNSLFDDLQKEADLQVEIAQLKEQSIELQTTLQNKLNILNQQGAAAIAKQAEEALKLKTALADMLAQLDAVNESTSLDLADPLTRARREYELAIQQVQLMEEEIKKAAEAAGVQVDITKELEEIYSNLGAQLLRTVKEIEGSSLEDVELLPTGQARKAEDDLSEFAAAVLTQTRRIRKNYEDGLGFNEGNPFERITIKLKEAFNLNDADLQQIQAGIGQIFGSFLTSYEASIQRQLSANQELIDSIKERRATVEEELEAEIRAQELGYANNVDAKKRELEAISKEEQKAQAEREKIVKKQIRAQLIRDAAVQASSLSTAVAEIFKANAGIPVVGIITALGAIATMFASFAAAKAQASQASAVRLYKGGAVGEATRDFGIVQERGGRSDVPGRNRGHMVEGTNLMLGGREFVHKESVSQQHRDFFELLNANEHLFRGVDLIDLFSTKKRTDIGRPARDFAFDRKVMTAVDRKRKEEMTERAIEKAFGKVIEKQTKDLIRHDETKDEIFFDGGKKITVKKSRAGQTMFISPVTS